MDLEQLSRIHRDRILFECVSGSRAYGTDNADSDTDIRGVFAQNVSEFLVLSAPQSLIADERHNTVYYSLRRALELLTAANPNILELLYMPADCIRIDTAEMQELRRHRHLFMTRQCADTHIGYAFSQIKKAKGQNKWINQPKPEIPPSKEDFCFVLTREVLVSPGTTPCRPAPLGDSGINLSRCVAARVEHAQGLFRIYHGTDDSPGVFRGDVLTLSSIPIEWEATRFVGLLFYNERSWQQAMEDHRNYWTWRSERNEARWRQQESGDLDFDAKNLMHTIRLLMSGQSILDRGHPIVRFEGADLQVLRDIRAGRLSYTEIMEMAEHIKASCMLLRQQADLPETSDPTQSDRLFQQLTQAWENRCP